MKIHHLKIRNFRNLKNFEIEFKQGISVLLGKNGSAKSNLLEFVAHIFAELELGQPPQFDYWLSYECRTREVEIDARYSDPEKVRVNVDGENVAYRQFVNKESNNYQDYLPTNIFIYYSGLSNRMEQVCRGVKDKYRNELLKGGDPRLRRSFLTDGSHSSLMLFAFLADFRDSTQDSKKDFSRNFLRERLGIVGVESVRLHLSRPSWMRRIVDIESQLPYPKYQLSGLDSRYWYTGGRILETFRVLQRNSIPLREEIAEDLHQEVTGRTELRSLHFYFNAIYPTQGLLLQEQTQSNAVAGFKYAPFSRPKDLFQRLDDLRLAGYGLDIHFKLELEKVKEPVPLTYLSEGEQQLLTVIGLLYFTKDNDTLFLLDEPDTHLNPQWSYEYKKMLEEAMQEGDGGDSIGSSQILMATHDPVLIAGLTKESVWIMERREAMNGREAEAPDETERIVTARPPKEDPRGMGVARILTSPMFGLRSILDEETLNDLDKKRDLAFKKDRSPEETEELKRLVRKLRAIDLTYLVEDPLYSHFVKAVVNHKDYFRLKKLFLNDHEFDEFARIANESRDDLLRELAEEEE